MNLDRNAIQNAIKAKVVELADQVGSDAADLSFDELIPASGTIDSAGLLELVAWFEASYQFRVPDSDFTIDNLGSIALMTDYLLRIKQPG